MKVGQSLIEVMVSIAIAALLGVALVSTAVLTQKASKSAQISEEATKFVQENIEEMRIFRDQSVLGIGAFQPTGCYTLTNTKVVVGLNTMINPVSTWSFTPVAGFTSACPVPPTDVPPASTLLVTYNNETLYRYIFITNTGSGNSQTVTGRVFVVWQEQSGWRTISDDVFLTKWVGP